MIRTQKNIEDAVHALFTPGIMADAATEARSKYSWEVGGHSLTVAGWRGGGRLAQAPGLIVGANALLALSRRPCTRFACAFKIERLHLDHDREK